MPVCGKCNVEACEKDLEIHNALKHDLSNREAMFHKNTTKNWTIVVQSLNMGNGFVFNITLQEGYAYWCPLCDITADS